MNEEAMTEDSLREPGIRTGRSLSLGIYLLPFPHTHTHTHTHGEAAPAIATICKNALHLPTKPTFTVSRHPTCQRVPLKQSVFPQTLQNNIRGAKRESDWKMEGIILHFALCFREWQNMSEGSDQK
jgi:hypothetical protein